ncbi:REG-2-like, HAD superfamily (subfamily IA) hydrolase [Halothece sp. PCC 7418]|uniref:HAD-IA family hydrolase n=1 Tax=Halothece sp. (strain PCC 7418) TaxID=65093 RepID=UPI0002A071AA|nr:HAD family hydrolase [Halothece sp. PCC 7418]AFZ44367.1 REG-2-like, HAD superfamily (subfamily IA) hydrolase [Halothece sp. PCC 7418]
MSKPEVIFLDAVGTLFGVKGSVGEVYSAIARSFGVLASPQALDTAFDPVFKSAPPPAFPDVSASDLPKAEFQWWRDITYQTFQEVGVVHKFLDFDIFFTRLYNHFATANPWELYSDVIPCLQHWRDQGIQLGVISNFDSRLYRVLNALDLKRFFTTITISSEVGAAKPDPKIFQSAIAQYHVSPEQTWHIGDSRREDYEAAKALGMHGFLLKRKSLVLK